MDLTLVFRPGVMQDPSGKCTLLMFRLTVAATAAET